MPQSTLRPSGAATTPKTPYQLVTISGNQIVTQSTDALQANK